MDESTRIEKFNEGVSLLIKNLYSDDQKLIEDAIKKIRLFLVSGSISLSVQLIVDLGIVSRLIEILQLTTNTIIQYECVWIFTNISSDESDHCYLLYKSGIISILKDLLGSANQLIVNQSLWCIANLAADENQDIYNAIAQTELVEAIIKAASKPNAKELWGNCMTILLHLTREEPDVELSRLFIPLLARCLWESKDDDNVFATTIEIFHLLTRSDSEEFIDHLLATNVIPKAVYNMRDPDCKESVLSDSILIVANVSRFGGKFLKYVLDHNVLELFKFMIEVESEDIKMNIYFALSNMFNDDEHLDLFIKSDILNDITHDETIGDNGIVEMIWVVRNTVIFGIESNIKYLLEADTIEFLVKALQEVEEEQEQETNHLLECCSTFINQFPNDPNLKTEIINRFSKSNFEDVISKKDLVNEFTVLLTHGNPFSFNKDNSAK